MVVIGYDDGLEAFEVLNSWGTHWGNNGFVWIKYKDFGWKISTTNILVIANGSTMFCIYRIIFPAKRYLIDFLLRWRII